MAAAAGGVAWALAALGTALAVPSGPVRTRSPAPGVTPAAPTRRGRGRLPVIAAAAVGVLLAVVVGGVAGLLAGAVGGAVGAWIVGWVQRRSPPPPQDERLAFALDLVAAGLQSGLPMARALEFAAPAAPHHEAVLRRVGDLLQLGADPAHAWAAVPATGGLGMVARVAGRSGVSGARVAAALERTAADIRAERHAHRLARAARAGVAVLGSLGACFLPSFVCLGVVPVVAGLLRSAQLAGP